MVWGLRSGVISQIVDKNVTWVGWVGVGVIGSGFEPVNLNVDFSYKLALVIFN